MPNELNLSLKKKQTKRTPRTEIEEALGAVSVEEKPFMPPEEVKSILGGIHSIESLLKTIMLEFATSMKGLTDLVSQDLTGRNGQPAPAVESSGAAPPDAIDLSCLAPILEKLQRFRSPAWTGKKLAIQDIIASLESVKQDGKVVNVFDEVKIPLVEMLAKECGFTVENKIIYC